MSITITNKPRAVDLAKNRFFFRVIANNEGTSYEDYHVRAKISVENLSAVGTYYELPEIRLDTDQNGLTTLYDLGHIISRRTQNFFDLPDWSMTKPVKALATLVRYNVVFREMDGDTEINTTNSGTLKALNGRVNQSQHLNFDIKNWITENKKFLTNGSDRVYTFQEAKHYLYFLNPYPDALTLNLKINAETSNGKVSLESSSLTPNPLTLQPEEIILIPVSDIIQNNINGTLYQSIVTLENDSGTTVAGPKTYYYQPRRPYAKAFLYQNRFGVFDTLTTTSETNTLETERQESRRNLASGYKSQDGNLSSELTTVADTFKAKTGPIPISMAQHYKEMIESNAVFLQGKDRWIRVKTDKGSFNISDENDELQTVTFTYRPAFAGDLLFSDLNLPKAPQEDYSQEYLKTDYQ
jgi:hypothetical protein